MLRRTFLALSVLFLALAPRVFAWDIERYENDITVLESGVTQITETISVNFYAEERHGIFRDIPVFGRNDAGKSTRTRLNVLSVTEAGNPVIFVLIQNGDFLRIRIGDPKSTINGRHTYQIIYEVEDGAIRFFSNHDEFYWNLIGTGWEAPIRANISRIQIPKSAEGVRVTGYQGGHGSLLRVNNIQQQGNRFTVSSDRPLMSYEGVTIAIGWNKGAVQPPSSKKKMIWWFQDYGIYSVPVFILFFMLLLWSMKGRDPKTGRSIAVEYEAPSKLTPAEMGALLDQKADMKDITATVVDLAVRGYIKIQNNGKKMFETDYEFTRLNKSETSLKPHEIALLSGMFGKTRETVKLSSLKDKFYDKLDGIKKKIYQSLIDAKLMDGNPDSIRGRYVFIGIVLCPALFFVFRFIFPEDILLTKHLGLASLISAVVVIVIGQWMPRRTLKGAGIMDKAVGFKEFIHRADRDRIKQINDPSLFERCLPYAMAFGFADQWAKAFEGLTVQTPDWYADPSGKFLFTPRYFSSSMNSMSSSMGTAFGSAASSGGSGSGGGGFSGGGGGGGGGGAW